MSNPLLDAARPPTVPQTTAATPSVGAPPPKPTDLALFVSPAACAAHVAALQTQIDQLTTERDGNRALVAGAAALRAQRNVLLATTVALAAMVWWRSRR